MLATPLALLVGVAFGFAQPARWTTNVNNTLLWEGKPYMPVGLRIPGSPEAIKEAKAAGVGDVLIDLPADGEGWKAAIDAVRACGLRYMIAVSSAAPTAEVIAVEPEAYRIGPITAKLNASMRVPGGRDALVVVAVQRDSRIRWSKRIPIANGALPVACDEGAQAHVMLVYPRVLDLRAPDYWEGFDRRRDEILRCLRSNDLGSNFRGLVNPMGAVVSFPPKESQYVPTSPLFRLEFEAFLRQKYGSVATALKGWCIGTNDITAFADLAALVPLWSQSRGVPQLWNPQNDKLYPCDSGASAVWNDIRETLRNVAGRRYMQLVQSVHRVADVPVIQDWCGWNGPYEGGALGLDGIGASLSGGSVVELLDAGSRPASAMLRSLNHPFLAATQISGLSDEPGKVSIAQALTELEGMGVRAWFFRADTPAQRSAVANEAAQRAQDAGASEWQAKGLFYPEAARNPAAPSRVAGGFWWLPAPSGGNRIDYGSRYAGYVHIGPPQTYVAIWSKRDVHETTLRFASPKAVILKALDGSIPQTKVVKEGIRVTIGPEPLLVLGSDQIPIPEDALADTANGIDGLLTVESNRVDATGSERLYFNQTLKGFARDPAASFATLRAQLRRLALKAAPFAWIEAEACRDHDFSEIVASPGASADAALTLAQRIVAPVAPHRINFQVNCRKAEEREFWIGARLPVQARDKVTVRMGDYVLKLKEGPVSYYGDGFAWYRAGTMKMPAGQAKMSLQVEPGAELDIAVDVIVATPSTFAPDGPNMPLDWLPVPAPKKKGR